MSDFPGKSAKSRLFASLRRLTARLPDVGKVTVPPNRLIRVPDCPQAARIGAPAAFKAPSLRISPVRPS
jgi:hypothetical protein